MSGYGRLASACVVLLAAGCVPISDYRALEDRFRDQEEYVVANKDVVTEMERRDHASVLRAKEQERVIELLRTRLTKSETLRKRMQENLDAPAPMPASAPRVEAPTVLGLEVNPDTQGLVLESGLLFSPGSAVLSTAGKQVLNRLRAELNKPNYAGHKISVEGHTDNTPIKRSGHVSNWDLSSKRALAVLHYLHKSGIDGKRLAFSGFGPFKPLDLGKTKKAFSRNRRVEIVLYEN